MDCLKFGRKPRVKSSRTSTATSSSSITNIFPSSLNKTDALLLSYLMRARVSRILKQCGRRPRMHWLKLQRIDGLSLVILYPEGWKIYTAKSSQWKMAKGSGKITGTFSLATSLPLVSGLEKEGGLRERIPWDELKSKYGILCFLVPEENALAYLQSDTERYYRQWHPRSKSWCKRSWTTGVSTVLKLTTVPVAGSIVNA